MNLTKDHRRVRYIEIYPEAILDFLKEGYSWSCIDSGIPEGAEFRGISHSIEKNCFQVYFSHPSFHIVPEGCICPRQPSPVITKITLKDKIYEVND